MTSNGDFTSSALHHAFTQSAAVLRVLRGYSLLVTATPISQKVMISSNSASFIAQCDIDIWCQLLDLILFKCSKRRSG
jgi:hypothetical protein